DGEDGEEGEIAVAVVAEPAPANTVDTVLLPMNSATVSATYGQVSTPTILASQFADVPRIANPTQLTLREEDKIMAYYSAGELYATPERSEPLL
ncbi:MAG: photosynthetic reaction center subunit H, partial [Pseudomonadota bacterium]